MTRDELIDKAAKFMAADASPDMVILTLEKFADFAISLQESESKPWPQALTVVIDFGKIDSDAKV